MKIRVIRTGLFGIFKEGDELELLDNPSPSWGDYYVEIDTPDGQDAGLDAGVETDDSDDQDADQDADLGTQERRRGRPRKED